MTCLSPKGRWANIDPTKGKVISMSNNFLSLTDSASLEKLLDKSRQEPVVVFKHSNACPISSAAYREMEKFQGEVNLLVIQAARSISKEIESLTGVAHESPQVIIIRDGKAVWDASHFDVKAGAVAKALEANG
jgi:bacillithiol system protein YtxJ